MKQSIEQEIDRARERLNDVSRRMPAVQKEYDAAKAAEDAAWGDPRGEPEDLEAWQAASRHALAVFRRLTGLIDAAREAENEITRLSAPGELAARLDIARNYVR